LSSPAGSRPDAFLSAGDSPRLCGNRRRCARVPEPVQPVPADARPCGCRGAAAGPGGAAVTGGAVVGGAVVGGAVVGVGVTNWQLFSRIACHLNTLRVNPVARTARAATRHDRPRPVCSAGEAPLCSYGGGSTGLLGSGLLSAVRPRRRRGRWRRRRWHFATEADRDMARARLSIQRSVGGSFALEHGRIERRYCVRLIALLHEDRRDWHRRIKADLTRTGVHQGDRPAPGDVVDASATVPPGVFAASSKEAPVAWQSDCALPSATRSSRFRQLR
jgi:hypothetical protein